mgnify:CR=1 FL=1
MQSHIVAVPPPHIGGMYWIFVSLQTHCGIEGVGEVYASTFHPEVMVKVLDDVFDRYLKGHDPPPYRAFFSGMLFQWFYPTPRPDDDGRM